jgi:hypothetical protein
MLELARIGLLLAVHTHEEGIKYIFHVIGRLPDLARPDLDLLVELVQWHCRHLAEDGVHALELSGEGLDFQPDTLLELVLLLEQLQQLGGGKPNAPVTKSLLAG